jgi:inhibitor of growth protein 3
MGAGSSAIAAAASQALAATHYNVPGRRSSSLKASFEAISQGLATRDLSIGQELAVAAAATSALAATAVDGIVAGGSSGGGGLKKQKVKQQQQQRSVISGGLGLDVVGGGALLEEVDGVGGSLVDGGGSSLTLASPSPSIMPVTPGGSQGSDQEWNYDPNEPRYCICNQVIKLTESLQYLFL